LNLFNESYAKIRDVLKGGRTLKALVGFDGFVDVISRAVKTHDGGEMETYFQAIEDFADFIHSRADKSCGIELKTIRKKIGGNAPLTALALRKLEVGVNLVGALGFPKIKYYTLFTGGFSV
jgi:hypothetical protein